MILDKIGRIIAAPHCTIFTQENVEKVENVSKTADILPQKNPPNQNYVF